MIRFKDFAQKVTEIPGWFSSGRLEPIEDTMNRMNNWINEVNPDLVNMETIWIPFRKEENHNLPIKLSMSDGKAYYPIQVFRVWYRSE